MSPLLEKYGITLDDIKPATALPSQPIDLEQTITDASTQYGLDRNLLRALVKRESSDVANARPYRGGKLMSSAYGYTQLTAPTAQDLGVDHRDPVQNIYGGAKYLKQQLDTFNGDIPTALTAYFKGPAEVKKFGLNVPGTTGGTTAPDYVDDILKIKSDFDSKPLDQSTIDNILAKYIKPSAAQPPAASEPSAIPQIPRVAAEPSSTAVSSDYHPVTPYGEQANAENLLKKPVETAKALTKTAINEATSLPVTAVKVATSLIKPPEELAKARLDKILSKFHYELTDEQKQILTTSGLAGEVLTAAASMVGQLPEMATSIGFGKAIAKKIVKKVGKEAVLKALPTVAKIAGPKAMPFIEDAIGNAVGFGALGGVKTGLESVEQQKPVMDAIRETFTSIASGVVMGPIYAASATVGDVLASKVSNAVLKLSTKVAGGAAGMTAAAAATGTTNPKELFISALLGGFLTGVPGIPKMLHERAKAYSLDPTTENKAALDIAADDYLKTKITIPKPGEAINAEGTGVQINAPSPQTAPVQAEAERLRLRNDEENRVAAQQRATVAPSIAPPQRIAAKTEFRQEGPQTIDLATEKDDARGRAMAEEIGVEYRGMNPGMRNGETTPPTWMFQIKGGDPKLATSFTVPVGSVLSDVKIKHQAAIERMQPGLEFGDVKVNSKNVDHLTQLPDNSVTKKHISDLPDDHLTASIDADNFKAVNDVGEHISGDKVLTQIGALINKHFPEYFRGREGGEEFHVDFGKIELTPELEARIKAFHDEAARTLSVKWMDKNGTERIESVTLSIGIGKGKNPKTGSLISDRMVYNAKENGRNQIAIEKNKEKTDNISYISGSPVKKEYLSEFSKKQAKAAINELQQSGNLDAGTARRIISEIDGGEAGAPNSGRGVQPQVPPAGTAAAKPAEAVVQPGATGKAVVQQPTNQAGIEGSKPKVGADENAVRAYKSEAERHPDYTQGRFGLGLWKSVNEFVEITPAVSDLIVSGHVNDIPTKFFKIPDALEKIKNYLESHAEWVQTTEGQQAYADIGKNPPKDAGDVADFMDYSPSNEIALRKLLKQTIKKLKTEEENAAAETQAYNEGKTKPPESMPGNENLSFQRTAKVQPEGNQQSLELSPETKPPEVPAITTAKPEQPKQQFSEQTADLFAGTEHAESRTPEQIEADLKAQAERGEVKYRQAQTKGGEAPIEDLPLFQESAGQQELQLQKPEKVSEKKGDAARVQSWVNEGFSGIKDKVVVVQSDTELPQNHVEKIKSEGAEGQIAAVYDNGTGKIYVVADNLPSRGATGRAIMHELFHKGARNMFGAVPGKLGTKLHDVYDDMYSSIPESERKRISDLYLGKGFDANNIKHRFRVVDEVLASRGESAINPTLMQKFLSLLRAALRKMGIVQKYSDNDLLNFIAKAQEAGADIEAKGQPMFKREESVAFKKKTKDEAQQEIFPKEDVEKDLRIFNIAGTDLEPFVKRMMEVDDPDISGILLEQAKRYEPQILESRRGVVSNEETANLARAYSEKVDVQQKLIGRVNAQAWNAHQIAAAMGVVKSATKTLQESAVKYRQKLKEGTLSEKDKADFMRQQALHGMLMLQMLGSRAEAGRALQIFNVFTRVFKEADAMKRIIGEGGQGTKIEKIIEKLSTFDPENTAGINDLLKKPKWRQVLDALYEVWLNSILSAPTTHVVNISSNLATTMLRSVVERPIQAIASKIVGREEPHYLGEGARELYGFISGMKDAWNTFSHSWQTGESLVSGKVEGQQPVSAIEQAFGEKTKRVSKVIRIPTRFLGASDDFFKVLVQRGTLHADAYRTAKILLKKGKINKHQFAAQVKHLVENPTGRMKERAIKEGQYRTFTNDVGKATQYLMDLREMFPPLKLIVPFIKTPTNIAKYALERIPGTIAVKAAMGKINKENIADELAKQTVGAGLAGLAVALSQAGLISGAGPKNKNERESLYRKGWLPYSVLIGDQYYSFARLEPLASTIGLAADFADASKLQQKGAEKKKIINNLMYSIGKNLLSKTYVSSLNNLIDVLSDPDRNAEKFINQMSGSLIPNIIAASARASDDELKQINNLADNILSRIPKQLSAIGVKTSKDVLPKRDIWGETIHTPTTGFEKLLSPIQRSRAVSDKVNEELSSIGFAPSSPSKAVTIDKQKVELTDDEYSRLQQNAGKLAYKTLAEIISNSEYSKLDDEQKKDLLTKYYDNSLAIERNKIMPEILRRIGKIK